MVICVGQIRVRYVDICNTVHGCKCGALATWCVRVAKLPWLLVLYRKYLRVDLITRYVSNETPVSRLKRVARASRTVRNSKASYPNRPCQYNSMRQSWRCFRSEKPLEACFGCYEKFAHLTFQILTTNKTSILTQKMTSIWTAQNHPNHQWMEQRLKLMLLHFLLVAFTEKFCPTFHILHCKESWCHWN